MMANTTSEAPRLSAHESEQLRDLVRRFERTRSIRPVPAPPAVQSVGFRSHWFVSKWFDLLFVCGLAPWILGLSAIMIMGANPSKLVQSGPQTVLTIFFILSSLLIGEAHQFTSILRYYGSFRHRTPKYRWHRAPFWVLYGFLAVFAYAIWGPRVLFVTQLLELLGNFFGTLATLALKFFPAFLMHHFVAQARAIGAIYCRTHGFQLHSEDQQALNICSIAIVLAGVCAIAQPFGDAQGSGAWVIYAFACACVALTAGKFIAQGIHSGRWLPLPAVLVWSNIPLLLILPEPIKYYIWLFVPIFFHATQHWAVAWLTRLTERGRQSAPGFGSTSSNNEPNRLPDVGIKIRPGKIFLEAVRMIVPIEVVSLLVLFSPILFTNIFERDALTMSTNTIGLTFSLLVFYAHYFADRVVWRPTK